MLADERSRGMGIRNHEQAADCHWIPSFLIRQDPGQDADFSLKGAGGRLKVADAGLDFNDEQDASRRVPSDDVRRTTLAEMVERHLDSCQPSMGLELADDVLNESRMPAVHQAIDVARPPPGIDRERDIQCRPDGAKALQGDLFEAPKLDPGDRGLAHEGRGREIALPPSSPDPNFAYHTTDASIIHARRMTAAPYSRLIRSRTEQSAARPRTDPGKAVPLAQRA